MKMEIDLEKDEMLTCIGLAEMIIYYLDRDSDNIGELAAYLQTYAEYHKGN